MGASLGRRGIPATRARSARPLKIIAISLAQRKIELPGRCVVLYQRKDPAQKDSPEIIKAFVLIQTVPGRIEGILRALRRIPQVRAVDPVTGPYDIVAQVEVKELRELSTVVAGTIGGLRGVTRTTTLLATG